MDNSSSPLRQRLIGWGRQLKPMLLALGFVLIVRTVVAEPYRVPSPSMVPTLLVGDELIGSKFAYGYGKYSSPIGLMPDFSGRLFGEAPERGDVIVFRLPRDPSTTYVKRLIGLPGDVVRFDAGAVSVNGAPFNVTVLSEGTDSNAAPEDRGQWLLRETAAGASRTIKVNPFVMGRLSPEGMGVNCTVQSVTAWQCTVPQGEYLMMGDNRDNSADSRVWGFLPHEQVYGKAVRVLFNLHDLSRRFLPL